MKFCINLYVQYFNLLSKYGVCTFLQTKVMASPWRTPPPPPIQRECQLKKNIQWLEISWKYVQLNVMCWKISGGAGFRLAQFFCFSWCFFGGLEGDLLPPSKIGLKQLRQCFPKWCIWCVLCSETKPLKGYSSKIGNIDLSLNISTNTLQRWFLCR